MKKVKIEKKKLQELEKKASFLEELLELIEDRNLVRLLKETETEEDIPLSEVDL